MTSIDRSLLILCILGLTVSICGCSTNSNIGATPYTSVQPTPVPTPAQLGYATVQGTPFSISGEVIDANGNPVPGALVTLLDNTHNVLGERTTGQNGTYDFLNVLSDTTTVTVMVNFTKDGVIYTDPSDYIIHSYPARGSQTIPGNATQIPDYPPPAFSPTHTFSVYGHVKYSNGTSIRGATVGLLESYNKVMMTMTTPAVQSTVTDNNGNFQFTNVTTNYSICGILVNLPVDSQYQNPYYFSYVNNTGMSYINMTDVPLPNPELTVYPPEGNTVIIVLGLGVVCLFGLFCWYEAIHHKK